MVETMRKKQIIGTAVLVAVILATICFIFSNSMESPSDSSAKSEKVLRMLMPAFEFFLGEGNVTHHMIRKLAHFTEFFVLGTELSILFVMWKKPLVWALFVGLTTALTDETIQIFYQRGSQVQDVWLDFSAVVTAAVLAYLFGVITRHRKERK